MSPCRLRACWAGAVDDREPCAAGLCEAEWIVIKLLIASGKA
jgi:hypothetical protein